MCLPPLTEQFEALDWVYSAWLLRKEYVEGASNPFWCASMGEGCPRRKTSCDLIDWELITPGVGWREHFLLCVKHCVQKCPEDIYSQYNLNSPFKFLIPLKAHFDYEIRGELVMLLLEATWRWSSHSHLFLVLSHRNNQHSHGLL